MWNRSCEFLVHAASITVTNTNDNAPGSLRQALTIANDGDTIKFEVTDTITLTSGGLPINKNITISGPGRDQLSIDGNQAIIVFGVFPGRAPTMSGLTVGLCNYGVAAVSSCVLTGNLLGLYSYEGETIVRNCVVSGNSAPSAGGTDNGGDAELSNTILNAGASGENIFNNGGTVTSHTYNISSDNSGGVLTGPGDQINTDPLLGPLQDNSGPTLTHLPGRVGMLRRRRVGATMRRPNTR